MAPSKADCDAIIIGAGFSGIRTLWELDQLGLNVKCFEAGSNVGGVWYWNRYPGARTDSEGWVYAMNFADGAKDEWKYSERYPGQAEVQQYLSRIADRFDLRKYIEFNTRVLSAHYDDHKKTWTVTTSSGASTSCQFLLAATGFLSSAKKPPFQGVETFSGEWYNASTWPQQSDGVDLQNKRIAVIGTGATGVQIIPKVAPIAKELIVFQRTPNYVLPGRNYTVDEHQRTEVKQKFDITWDQATKHPFGLAMTGTGKTCEDLVDPSNVRQIMDRGWESGGFHFQFETVDDIATNQKSNDIASEYLRQKIRAIVDDPETAEKLCPKHPVGAKRPPCGHFYYESYNRPNVKLVDISQDNITIYDKGVQTSSAKYEFDIIISALGYDAGTGALDAIDVRGVEKSLKHVWSNKLETFAGVLTPGFPNFFAICGPQIPFGNVPVILDLEVRWIGNMIEYMRENHLSKVDVRPDSAAAWSKHLYDAFMSTLYGEAAGAAGSWYVGANIDKKANTPLYYFGGVPNWNSWFDSECKNGWPSMEFSS